MFRGRVSRDFFIDEKTPRFEMDIYSPKHVHGWVVFPAFIGGFPAFDQSRIFQLCLFAKSVKRLEVESAHKYGDNRLRDAVWNAACIYIGALEDEVQIVA